MSDSTAWPPRWSTVGSPAPPSPGRGGGVNDLRRAPPAPAPGGPVPARDLRLLTVPTATPSAVAVSRLVSARCSAARPPRAARRSPRRALARRRRQGDACRVVRSRDIGQRTRRPLSPPVPPLVVAERVNQGPVDVRVTVVCPAYLRPADVASRERGLDDIRGVVTRAAQPDGRTHQRPPARTDTR